MVIDEIQPRAVDDEQRRCIVSVEVAAVRFGEAGKVGRGYLPLELDAAPVHALDQRVDRRLEVDHEVRCGGLRLQVRIDLFIELVLGIGKVQPGEQRVLVEQEIADGHVAEHVELADTRQLVHALKQERELGRQRKTRHVAVEALEERVLLGPFEQFFAAHVVRERPCEAGLAGPDRPLDDDVSALFEVHRGLAAGQALAQEMGAGTRDTLVAHVDQKAAGKPPPGNGRHRRHIGERAQHERALVHARVRHGEPGKPEAAASV